MSLMELSDAVMLPPALAGLRSRARHLLVRALGVSGHLKRARSAIAASGDTVVLTLHRIVPDAQLDACCSPHGMVLREDLFARLIEYLRQNAHVISPQEAETKTSRSKLPQVLITFDDGWLDNIDVALPYLEDARFRACFFVVTSLMGETAPFWPEALLGLIRDANESDSTPLFQALLANLLCSHGVASAFTPDLATDAILLRLKQLPAAAVKEWIAETRTQILHNAAGSLRLSPDDRDDRLMTWEQARSLLNSGHRVASHTCTHPILPQLEAAALHDELHESRVALLEHLHGPSEGASWLSYPNGSVDGEVSCAAFDAGYRRGFTNSPGLWRAKTDPLLLPRVNVWDGTLVNEDGEFCEKQLEYSLFWRTSHARA